MDGAAWIDKIDDDDFTATFAGNLTNNLALTKLVVPIMHRQGGGSIVFTSSSAGAVRSKVI